MKVGFVKRTVACGVIRDRHIIGIVTDFGAGTSQDLTIEEKVCLLVSFLGIVLDTVDHGRPEIAFIAAFICRQLDMLCSVKTETVYAAIHTILQQ